MENICKAILMSVSVSVLFACSTFRPPIRSAPVDVTPGGSTWGGYDESGNTDDNWFFDYYEFFRMGEPPHPFDYGGYYGQETLDDDWFYDFYELPSPF